jgi:hypothetical protein
MLNKAIVAAILVASFPMQGQAKQVQYYGFPGHDSCGDWTSHRKSRDNQILEGWVLGYVTAANVYGDNDGLLGTGSGSTGMLAWVDQYCAANPLDSIFAASAKLVVELKRRRENGS